MRELGKIRRQKQKLQGERSRGLAWEENYLNKLALLRKEKNTARENFYASPNRDSAITYLKATIKYWQKNQRYSEVPEINDFEEGINLIKILDGNETAQKVLKVLEL
ncbi:hypothetical protein K9L16_03610 [Candidatus Pacearchaeota archaeon]|nr:hypothetical protein [Candidatus Pacearchaeota archaeon]